MVPNAKRKPISSEVLEESILLAQSVTPWITYLYKVLAFAVRSE